MLSTPAMGDLIFNRFGWDWGIEFLSAPPVISGLILPHGRHISYTYSSICPNSKFDNNVFVVVLA